MKNLLALVLIGLPIVAFAASNPDESFFKDAARAGMAEVAAGQTAEEKGSSQAVEDFGAMMVEDHSAANAKLKKIAAAKGVELPDSPSIMQKAMNKKTDLHSGDSFDKDYKAFATETLPKVKAHLDKISKIAADAGVSA